MSELGFQCFMVDYRVMASMRTISGNGLFSGGILCGEMLLHENGLVNGISPTADVSACGMIYAFYGRLSVATRDVELLRHP